MICGFALFALLSFPVQGGLLTSNAPAPKYTVALAIQPPYLERYEKPDGHLAYRGLTWDLWESVISQGFGSHVNFTYEEMPQYPMYPNERGQLLGQIGALVKGTVDVALGPFMHSPQAEQFVDFSMPYTPPVGITAVYKRQTPQPRAPHDIGSFLKSAVCVGVWMLICAACMAFSLFWLAMVKVGHGCSKRNPTALEPKKLFPTLMLGSWLVCFALLITAYIDQQAGALGGGQNLPAYPIKSFDDLHKQYEIKFSTSENSAAYEYFKIMSQLEEKAQESYMESFFGSGPDTQMSAAQKSLGREYIKATNSKYQRLWRMMQAVGIFPNAKAGIKKVLENGFVYIGDTNEIRHAKMDHCELETIPDVIGEWPMVLAVQQGSPLINVINTAILKLLNDRQLSHLQEKWWDNNPNRKSCDKSRPIPPKSSINSILWALVLLLIRDHPLAFATGASAITVLSTWGLQRFFAERREKREEEKIQKKQLPPPPAICENDYVDLNDNDVVKM